MRELNIQKLTKKKINILLRVGWMCGFGAGCWMYCWTAYLLEDLVQSFTWTKL